jgi:hydroxymethylpyrimidine/phosphomethylpyrimidine kinase
MNPLDSLKDKLRIKPIVDEFKPINVIPSTYVAPNTPEKIKLSKVTLTDKRDTQFDIKELIKRLEDKKLSKITIKSTVKLAPTPSATRVQMFQEAPKELEQEQGAKPAN